jgi:hypothetical protein
VDEIQSGYAIPVAALGAIRQSDDYARIEQNRFHVPNPLRCF